MKLLAFSDTHGHIPSLKRIILIAKRKQVDAVICAGDISIFGNGIHNSFNMLSRVKKPALIIHGNHETEDEIIHCAKEHKNIINLHKKILNINNFTFIGYGGGGFSLRTANFENFVKKNREKIKNKSIILVTHAPPYGTKVDLILRQHCGNKSFRDFIKTFNPLISISGHLHETEGKKQLFGKTIVANPGYRGMIFNIEKI